MNKCKCCGDSSPRIEPYGIPDPFMYRGTCGCGTYGPFRDTPEEAARVWDELMQPPLQRQLSRSDYVNRFARWLVPETVTESVLDRLYSGKSHRIHSLIREAYFRGVRRGIGLVWEGAQPVTVREAEAKP